MSKKRPSVRIVAPVSLLVSLFVSLLVLGGATAASASHINGIRITQTGGTGLDVDIDVTAFYTVGSTNYTTAYIGSYLSPAIDWGDGSTVPYYGYGPSTGIPLVATSTLVNGLPARAYRGSFSHTYAAPAAYTITAKTACCAVTTPTNTIVTGYLTASSYLIGNTLSIVAGGVAGGIPTLSSVGLILLASMMLLIALVVLRRQGIESRF